MRKITLVLTDVDGTLVPMLSNVASEAVADAIKKVQDAGVELTAVTGRPYEMTKDLFVSLGFRDLSIFDGGATIRKVQTGEIVWKNWLDVDRLKEIVEILLPVSTKIDFFPVYNEVSPEETSLDEVVEPAPYVFAFVKEEHGDDVIPKLKALPSLAVQVFHPHDQWKGMINIQITDISADKYHAVQALRDIVHSEIDETLAIGDSINDLPLLKSAGVKVAMGNAIDELKEIADHVVADVEDDGFAEAMHKFVL